MKPFVYPIICLLVPQLWAVAVARGFALREQRKDRVARAKAASVGKDFSI